MWRQWSSNITRLFRWASCFTAPSDHEEDINDGFPNMVEGKKITSEKLFKRRSGSIDFSSQSHEQQNRNSAADDHENTTSRNNNNNNNSNNDSKQSLWTHFADDDKKEEEEEEDEDFIVFCFKEDGAFYIAKDGKSEPSNHIDYCTTRSSWSLNRKEEEGVVYLDIAAASSNRGMFSSESNRSDHSTGSFAFPVLSCEWIGSPVLMPKSQGLHDLRKHKSRSLIKFQYCCRF
ncbi:hypothetical protein Q3G72_029174 [Acer saccharum]|nr:hypothetical protein Q3G72_029174 [Acer saccharum]